MYATTGRSLRTSRRSVLLAPVVAALALTFTPLARAQAVDVGGSATGTGTYGETTSMTTTTLAVTGTPQAATGPVTVTQTSGGIDFTGVARCIAIDETATGFRASVAGEITGGFNFLQGFRGFELTVYDNTPSAQIDQISHVSIFSFEARTSCNFDFAAEFTLTAGDYTIVPLNVCPPGDDEDNDGLTDQNENLFSTLLGNADSDLDGIVDGNDDANENGEDDEDEDDADECPDEDSDGDGEDDEDEDDEDEDD